MSEMTGSSLIERKDFSKIPRHLDIPDLIEIQKRSYDSFLQMEVDPDRREDKGLQAALTSVFPIADYNSTAVLEFVNYSLGTPKYDVRECMEQGMSYAAPLKVRVRLVVLDKEDKSPTKKVLDVREQEVYIGELPLMTERGTFIINGTERVVVSQLHRSPGAFFTHDKGRTHASGKILFSARIIPYRCSWLDFEFDTRDILYVRIDRRRKMPATILLKAFGYSTDDLLRMYYPVEEIHVQKGKLWRKLDPEIHAGLRVPDNLVEKGGKEPIARESSKLTKATISRLKAAGIKEIEVNPEDLVGRTVLVDLVDIATKEKILEKNHKLTAEVLKKVLASKIDSFKVVFHDSATTASVIEDTLESEKTTSKEEAMVEIYKRLRPGETPSIETARALFENLFFNSKRYDLLPAYRGEIVAFGIEEEVLKQRTRGLDGGRFPWAQPLVDLDHGLFLGRGLLTLERVFDHRGGRRAVVEDDLERVDLAGQDLLQDLSRQLVILFKDLLFGGDVHQVDQDGAAHQVLVVDLDLFDPRCLQPADGGLGELRAFAGDGLLAPLLHQVIGDAQAGMDLRVQLPPQFALLDVDLLHGIVHPQEIIGGVPEGFQQDRRRHLSPPVNPDVEDVPRVKLKVEPRAAIRDDPRREQDLAAGVGAALVMCEEGPRRAVQLAHHHPLGPVDDERAALRHQRQFADIDLLLAHV